MTLSFSTIFNINSRSFKVQDTTNYASQGISLSDVAGVIQLTTPRGVTHLNTNYSAPDINQSVSLGSAYFSLPTNAQGYILAGTYSVQYSVKQISTGTISIVTNSYTYSFIVPAINIIQNVDGYNSIFTSSDSTVYGTYASLTRTHQVTPPSSSPLSVITSNNQVITYNPDIWSGLWTSQVTSVLVYNESDGLVINASLTATVTITAYLNDMNVIRGYIQNFELLYQQARANDRNLAYRYQLSLEKITASYTGYDLALYYNDLNTAYLRTVDIITELSDFITIIFPEEIVPFINTQHGGTGTPIIIQNDISRTFIVSDNITTSIIVPSPSIAAIKILSVNGIEFYENNDFIINGNVINFNSVIPYDSTIGDTIIRVLYSILPTSTVASTMSILTDASLVPVNTINFNKNLNNTIVNVQKLADAIDDLTVTPDTSVTNILTTGLISGGILSIHAGDATKFDITALEGVIINNTNPDSPTITKVSKSAQVGLTDTQLANGTTTYVYIDSTGTIILSTNYPDADTRRNLISIGWLDHPNNTSIQFAKTEPYYVGEVMGQLNDFFENFGPFNISGNVYSAYSGLSIQRSAGSIFDNGTNYTNDKKNPHVLTTGSEIPTSLTYYYRTSPGNWVNTLVGTTTIDPNYYDNGSGLTGVSSNYWTIQLISFYPLENSDDIQYGQKQYATYAGAIADLRGIVEINPYNQYDIFRTWLVVKQGATDLTNTNQAVFITADSSLKFLDLLNGGGGSLEITDHNSLNNIQGGDISNRYHLVVADYNNITAQSFQFSSAMSNYANTSHTHSQYLNTSVSSVFRATSADSQLQFTSASSNFLGTAATQSFRYTSQNSQLQFTSAMSNYQSTGAYLTTAMASNAGSLFQNTSANSLLQFTSATSVITSNAFPSANTTKFAGTGTSATNCAITLNSNGIAVSVSPTGGGDGVNIIAVVGSTANTTGTIVFSNANSVSFGLNGATITASIPSFLTTAMASNASSNFVNTSQSSLFQQTSATSAITASAMNTNERNNYQYTSNSSANTSVYIALGNSTAYQSSVLSGTFFQTANSSLLQATSATSNITSNAFATSNQSLLQYTSATSNITSNAFPSANTTKFAGTGTSAANASITLNSNGLSISVAAPGAAAENNWINLQGNTNSNSTASGSTIMWSAGNNITLAATNGSVVRIDGGAGVAIAGPAASSVTNGTLQFANANGISFGLNGSTMTASVTAGTNDVTQWSLVGANTAGTTTQAISNMIMYLSGGPNVTLSGNASTLVFSAPNPTAISYSLWEPLPPANTGTIQSNGTLFVYPVSVNQYVTASRAEFVVSVQQSVNATLANSANLSLGVLVYTLSNDSIRLATVSSATTQHVNGSIGSGSSTNSVSYTGQIAYSIPINVNMSPGLYWLGLWSRSTVTSASSTNNNQDMTMYGVAARSTNWYVRQSGVSANSAASSIFQLPYGFVTVSRSQTDLTSPIFIARSTAAGATTIGQLGQASRMPYIIFQNFTFPNITA